MDCSSVPRMDVFQGESEIFLSCDIIVRSGRRCRVVQPYVLINLSAYLIVVHYAAAL